MADVLASEHVLITHHYDNEEDPSVYAKETKIAAGAFLMQHSHDYPHLSIVAGGVVEVTANGLTTTIDASAKPQCVVIPAGTQHGVHALTDAYWFCIHAPKEGHTTMVDSI